MGHVKPEYMLLIPIYGKINILFSFSKRLPNEVVVLITSLKFSSRQHNVCIKIRKLCFYLE